MLTSCSCVSDGRGYVLCEVVSDGVCKEEVGIDTVEDDDLIQ